MPEKMGQVLLADDNAMYRKTMITLLQRRGHAVTEAANGDEVLAAATEQSFDAFVLDYKMPGNENLVLVEQLSALQPEAPVILLTGFASLPSAMSAVRLQLFDYIQKGENPDHLLTRIDEAVRHTQLEKRWRASEARYRLLAENIQDMITVYSAEGLATYVSPSIKTVLGYSSEEFLGSDMFQLVHPEDLAGLRVAIAELMENGLSVHEARFLSHNGSYIWLSTSAKVLCDSDGNPHEVICTSRDITERKRIEAALKASEVHYQRLAQYLEMVREEERTRLSRELHDDLGQILTALKIDLVVIRDGCTCEGTVKDKMNRIQTLLSSGIQRVHSLCRQLRPGALDDLGLDDALAGLVDEWRSRNGIACTLEVDFEDEALSDEIKTAVFRMVLEALTNISRHANASQVEICLVADEQVLAVSIRDDGCGMDLQAVETLESFGLLGMRERIEMIGGKLLIESSPGCGTRLVADIPLACIRINSGVTVGHALT